MDREDWNRRYEGSELVWTAEPNRFLVAEVEGLTPGRALDLACGEGRNAVWLAERGWRVSGVDFSDVAVAKARALAGSRGLDVEWIVADLVDFRPEPRAFELVVLLYLQLPSAERGPIVRRAVAAVARGGTFLLVGHDRRNLEDGYGGPRDPDVLYTPEDVVSDLDGVEGLAVERAELVRRPVATPEGDRVALDALVRVARTA
ncbi:MAG TPA: class I SAM-dependent methyltransferase [Gaiellaceae bacterium]|nr:class I SAM-dependent methyltransferase [Gaiellaceae bacterium]